MPTTWGTELVLQTRFVETPTHYDGTQLQPHWIYKNTGILGDALIAAIGGADVSLDHMVDQEDVLRQAPIYSPKMLHFLGEFFIDSLDQGILIQHLLAAEIYGLLWEKGARELTKRGNDIYYQGRKMSVSIATRSGVSILLHTALNIETEGTPIPTSGLKELGYMPQPFGEIVLERFAQQVRIWTAARAKVSPRL